MNLTLADYLVCSVTLHYLIIGWLYYSQNGQPLFLGLYAMYACANGFLIAIAVKAGSVGAG